MDAGELMDMSGRRLREPAFPRVTRQSPVLRMFLKRLQRLAMLEQYGREHLAFSEAETTLLKKSIYSVYRDLATLGAQREAQAVLRATERSAG